MAPVDVVRAPAAPDETGRRVVSVTLPAALHRWARIQGIETERSLSAIVVESLELLRAVVEREQ